MRTLPFEVLGPKDLDNAKMIWASSFGDEQDFIDHYFSVRVPPGHVFGLREAGELVSILCIIPMTYKIRDSLVPTAFVAGVATLPEKRGRGHIAHLISGVIPYLKEMGFSFAYLSPAVRGMYEKYGFDYCTQQTVLFTDRAAIPGTNRYGDNRIEICAKPEITLLASIYSRLTRNTSCIPVRQKEDWEFILYDLEKDGGSILTAWDKGERAGYMMYRCQDNTLESTESVFFETRTFFELANEALKRCSLDTGKFVCQPAIHGLKGSISEKGGMARIIDMDSIVRVLDDSMAAEGQATVSVDDPLCPWNNGVYEFGKVRNRAYQMQRTSKTPEIQMTIGQWTRWICGSAVQLDDKNTREGKLTEVAGRLAKILPKKNCICFDKY